MEKYYIIADLKRNPAAGEDVPPVPAPGICGENEGHHRG